MDSRARTCNTCRHYDSKHERCKYVQPAHLKVDEDMAYISGPGLSDGVTLACKPEFVCGHWCGEK